MRIFLVWPVLFLSLQLIAQQSPKKSLKIEDFANWKTISHSIISNNGKYISYELNPQKGDGNLIVVNNKFSDTISRGTKAVFGPEDDFIVYEIMPPESEIREAKLNKKKSHELPKDSLGILVFKDESVQSFANPKSFIVPEENARWIAFTLENEAVRNCTSCKRRKQPGDDLVIFEIETGDTTVFNNVTEYRFSQNGHSLFFVTQTKNHKIFSALHVFDSNTGTTKELFAGEGIIKKVVTDKTGSKYAFLFSNDTIKEKVFSLYYGNPATEAIRIVDSYSSGIPVGWSPSENRNICFSEDGTKLYFGTAESPEPEPKDTIPENEKPKLDIWNWKDLKLQSQQKLEANEERERTYLAVYHPDKKRLVQLADLKIQSVCIIQKGNSDVGLGFDDKPYLRTSGWTGVINRDYYLVDIESGIKRQILTEKPFARLSPQGKYVIWYEPKDSSWYTKSTNIEDVEAKALTRMIPVNFFEEDEDRPMVPSPYGVAGWSEDDRFVYIYDHYDIWKIDPSGARVPVNVTKAFGRRNKTRLRYVKLNEDLEYIPSDKNIMLKAFDERTKSSGFFSTQLNTIKDPDLLIMDKYHFDNLAKAKNANKLLWTKENVTAFPDLWSSNVEFSHAGRISNANPQQDDFLWPTVELVKWTSFMGETLEGLLYKPENFNPDLKYPMVVYFYERNSENLYRYQSPSPSRSTINKTFYTSNHFLVFVPDITYKEGYPGQSAYNSIVSGTQYLINKFQFVDEKRIGLQGQSWGGYQIAYLVTQTDLYAAAMAGAPVSNMTSAFGGIRWATGISRMFQYEHQQSRIGGSLWEKPLQYIENSPLFYAPKVTTPLLMMHNDNDGAVPWYQSIEFFVALRRLDKPCWLLSYNNESHNLRKSSWANRMDLSKRMFQFFNHYLKDQPMPEWMDKGVPAKEKGENLGY